MEKMIQVRGEPEDKDSPKIMIIVAECKDHFLMVSVKYNSPDSNAQFMLEGLKFE